MRADSRKRTNPMLAVTLVFLLLSLMAGFLWRSEVDGSMAVTNQSPQPTDSDNKLIEKGDLAAAESLLRTEIEADNALKIKGNEYRATIRKQYEYTDDLPDGISFSTTLASLMHDQQRDPALATRSFRRKALIEKRDALCDGQVPKVYGDEVYSLFERMDDYQDTLAEHYYLSVLDKLPEETAQRFEAWIDRAKMSTVSG